MAKIQKQIIFKKTHEEQIVLTVIDDSDLLLSNIAEASNYKRNGWYQFPKHNVIAVMKDGNMQWIRFD